MRLEEVFADVFEEPAERFDEDSTPETVFKWTSLMHITLLMEIESAYEIKFTNAEMIALRSLADIRAALVRRGVEVP
jgi:acyl carrier protein